MNSAHEATLWQQSTAGDGEAFALLFDRHHPRVYRHAHRLTADRHDAEDLTAGAYLELWRRRDKVRLIEGSVLPWLLVTTSNLARNHARGLRRYRTFLDRLQRSPAPSHTTNDDTWADLDGPWAKALSQLSAADLRLVTLVILEDQPLANAAALLGLTPQAAKSRLHRARQRLRTALEEADPERRRPLPAARAATSITTSTLTAASACRPAPTRASVVTGTATPSTPSTSSASARTQGEQR